MRFVLDEDVDVEVGRRLRKAGHEAWSIPSAGLSESDDDVVSTYADDRNAVLVTCDIELIRRRMENPFGRHLRLRGADPDLAAMVTQHLDTIVDLLGRADVIIVTASAHGAQIVFPRHLRTATPEAPPVLRGPR